MIADARKVRNAKLDLLISFRAIRYGITVKELAARIKEELRKGGLTASPSRIKERMREEEARDLACKDR